MRITNHANLPQALVNAVTKDNYSKGHSDYSTTELSVPSRIVALKKLHEDEIEEDVSDMIYALIGKLGHSILEHAGTADVIEERLYHTLNGVVVSGQVDVVDGSVLEDWKFTSLYSIKDGVKFEWIAQASINAYLASKNGMEITEARYIAILRDWSKTKVKRDFNYPRYQVQTFNVPLWSHVETESYILDRIKSHQNAQWDLPECTAEERWATENKIAVMKKGNKKALKLFESAEDALEFISSHKERPLLKMEDRPGESKRCENYCPVSQFCEQFKKLKAASES